MRFSERVQDLPPYLFAGIERRIAERRAAGVDVISLGIGDPDLPTPAHIVKGTDDGRAGSGDASVSQQSGRDRFPRGGGWVLPTTF